ncbi:MULTISPECIES: ABC transporter permease [Paraburkholderia]|jgi:peptide/nickel transport system permease protein|uniref:Glutathione ABC transporter permease GsiD n=1 Tax=Paraburkholderia largidicola TaxID=3014751 RepID=A0A7I8C068_9BURK|nr:MULTISPECIES: ABC transporter permease [Paraburkholderia]BEU27455.1 ABC transporter permease [Paraburkholderia sp. 22B1P]GJH34019.1 ABC transporter permease subunit [Paraburkholderia hospita]CAG9271382.1 dipeptide ABC transporter membrane subunit DppC [Paraburkholderia caribensis]BCF94283.1 glutathione ABC transporter permease GsiD [Paraburkholderia sp. PGU16]GJH04258.1 ABC transporter permease subunit [Paraburkholderia terrae]
MATSIDARSAAAATLPRRKRRGLVRFMRNKAAVFGALLVALIVVMALFAPWLTQYDPVQASFMTVRQAPSAAHWFGTDELGRDVLSRLLYGARASLLAGVVSVGIAVVLGVPLGLLAGYFGKLVDGVISRIADALLSIPFLILAIALSAFLGPSLTNAMAAIGISAMPRFIRLTRGQAISVKAEEYVEGARAIGLDHGRIILRYILPNVLPPIIVQASLTVASAIIAEASLSFLGLGQLPPSPSWGSMLNTAKDFVSQAPWMSIFPGIAIFLAVLGFNLLGDGLRDALDPRES